MSHSYMPGDWLNTPDRPRYRAVRRAPQQGAALRCYSVALRGAHCPARVRKRALSTERNRNPGYADARQKRALPRQGADPERETAGAVWLVALCVAGLLAASWWG